MSRARLLLVGLLAAFSVGGRARAACGEDLQLPCYKDELVSPCYECWNWNCSCWMSQPYCKIDGAYVDPTDGRCHTSATGGGVSCCDQVDYMDGGKKVDQGWIAHVDLTHAWIIIPNREVPGTCAANTTYHNVLASVDPNPTTNILSWDGLYSYGARLKVNANFFDVSDNLHPYYVECTNALGLTISNKEIVSPRSQVHDTDTQSLVFYTSPTLFGHEADIVPDPTSILDKVQNAVSGFQLLKGGVYVPQPSAIDPDCWRPRSVAGLTKDHNTLILVVVNPGSDKQTVPCTSTGGSSLPGLAAYLKTLGAVDALTLDGSGSAQLIYSPPGKAPVMSLPSDTNGTWPNTKLYRPVPVFLGFR